MPKSLTAGMDRRDFLQAGTVGTAAALGGTVGAASQVPSDPLAVLKELQILDLSVAIEHDAPGELNPPQIEYSTHESGGNDGRDQNEWPQCHEHQDSDAYDNQNGADCGEEDD